MLAPEKNAIKVKESESVMSRAARDSEIIIYRTFPKEAYTIYYLVRGFRFS